ncbi:MAG: histidine phosphatase family protein [Spirochaetales bacterium]
MFYAFRHAESLANVAGVIACDPVTSVPGFGLSDRGFQQVRDAALPWGSSPRLLIVTSDFRRARETAETLAARLGLPAPETPPELAGLLRERNFGPLEGQTSASYQSVWDHDAAGTDYPGVETVEQVCSRLDQLLAWLRSDPSRLTGPGKGPDVVLVSHGDVLQILLARAAGLPPRQHRSIPPMGNAECRAIRWE